MDNPLFSIITISYNAEKTIEKTIQSVVGQGYEHIEYIVIDGQSSDGTTSIINRYKDKISNIIIEPDDGIYDAMNKGIRLSSGDFLLFLNADDYFISDTVVQNLVRHIALAGSGDIYYGDIIVYDHESGHGKLWAVPKVTGSQIYNSSLPHPATIYRREIFNTLGLFDQSYAIAADYEFFVRAYAHQATYKHLDVVASVFSSDGFSSDPKNAYLIMTERQSALAANLSPIHRFYLRLRVRVKKIFAL